MLRLILSLLAPGEKIPPGATQYSFDHEGMGWGWAFVIFLLLTAAVAWSYRRYAPAISRFSRVGLVFLRCVGIGLLLLLFIRPILLITLEETIQRPLFVLLDVSQSMGLTDHRTSPEDVGRGALALDLIDPAGGLKQPVPIEGVKDISRRDLLENLAANTRLNLWPQLASRSSLVFYGFGRKLKELGNLAPPEGGVLTTKESASFFHNIPADENLTGLGEGLRDLLDAQRGQPTSGILLITDGASNTGSSPMEAASMAREDGVPLFIYGVGVASPQDVMVLELEGPRVSHVKERLDVKVRLRAQGMTGRKATVQLKANGQVVDEQPVEFRADGEQEIDLGYTPDVVGMAELEADVPPLPAEVVKNNNSARTQVSIVDDKIKVLLVEGRTSWDFQYLLATLKRDRRISLKCVLLKGDQKRDSGSDSVFLSRMPDDKATLFANDLVILGDVDPADLGDNWMKLLNEWVGRMGGGLLFRAGPKFDPAAYRGTPLAPLLPVEPDSKKGDRYPNPVKLNLTLAGENSPLLKLAQNAEQNRAIWAGFPGVYWTARVVATRPGAQVLLTDLTSDRNTREGPMPVIARQSYGLGETLFIGSNETYRWRSQTGEKYYTRIYSQLIQALTAGHISGAALIQLKTDKTSYLTGDRVKISGRIFQMGYVPLTDAEVSGTFVFTPAVKPGQPVPAPQIRELRLKAIADRPGEYQTIATVTEAGSYSYFTARDRSVVVKFQVVEPQMELSDIAMNQKLLQAMASASGGQFLREEDLYHLPNLVASKSTGSVSYKKIPLAFAPLVLIVVILFGCAEWLWRRKLELK